MIFYIQIFLQFYTVKSALDIEVMKEQRAIILKNPPLDSILILMDHEAEIAIQARQIVLQLVGIFYAAGVNMLQERLQFPKDVDHAAYRAIGEIHPVHLDDGSYEIHTLGYILNILLIMVHLQV